MEYLLAASGIVLIVLGALFFQAKMKLAANAGFAAEVPALREQLKLAEEVRTQAVTSFKEAEKTIAALKEEAIALKKEKEEAQEARAKAETAQAVALERATEIEKRMKDWELHKQNFTRIAEASVMEAGNKLSSKLLEDHKREAEEARKKLDEITKKNAEEVLGNLGKLIQSVNTTSEMNLKQETKIETLWRTMSAPASMGALSEVGLENTLKNLGLESPRDYIMQFTIKSGEGGLRPDALVKLPQDMVVVIDSKASKHVLELAQAEGEQQEAEVLQKLKKSMNDHLNALKSKDYAAAVQQAYRDSGNQGKVSMALMVMYIPSESALDYLKKADPEFESKCEKAGVIAATPASLFGVLSVASKNIGLARQGENHQKIMQEVEKLVEYCINTLGYAESIGKSIESSMKHYTAFTNSVNGRLLGKMKTVSQLGVQLPKNKQIPARLKTFEVHEYSSIIEAEAEYLEDNKVESLLLARKVEA